VHYPCIYPSFSNDTGFYLINNIFMIIQIIKKREHVKRIYKKENSKDIRCGAKAILTQNTQISFHLFFERGFASRCGAGLPPS